MGGGSPSAGTRSPEASRRPARKGSSGTSTSSCPSWKESSRRERKRRGPRKPFRRLECRVLSERVDRSDVEGQAREVHESGSWLSQKGPGENLAEPCRGSGDCQEGSSRCSGLSPEGRRGSCRGRGFEPAPRQSQAGR